MGETNGVRISFIIPTYGDGAYLDQCMESILAQPARDIEIVLVDDGCSYGAVCDACAQKDFKKV